jgi:hypothetical protein
MKYLCQLESKVGNNCDLLTPFTIISLEEKINDTILVYPSNQTFQVYYKSY